MPVWFFPLFSIGHQEGTHGQKADQQSSVDSNTRRACTKECGHGTTTRRTHASFQPWVLLWYKDPLLLGHWMTRMCRTFSFGRRSSLGLDGVFWSNLWANRLGFLCCCCCCWRWMRSSDGPLVPLVVIKKVFPACTHALCYSHLVRSIALMSAGLTCSSNFLR